MNEKEKKNKNNVEKTNKILYEKTEEEIQQKHFDFFTYAVVFFMSKKSET